MDKSQEAEESTEQGWADGFQAFDDGSGSEDAGAEEGFGDFGDFGEEFKNEE